MRRPVMLPRTLALAATLGAGLALSLASGTFAVSSPNGAGQPFAACGDTGAQLEPPGFMKDGFAHAELVYAGSDGAHSLVSGNEHAKAQYDIACVRFTASH
jgi:hypothetical protein